MAYGVFIIVLRGIGFLGLHIGLMRAESLRLYFRSSSIYINFEFWITREVV